jgi:hypothetical protein
MTLIKEIYELENRLEVAKNNVVTLKSQLDAVKEKLDNSELRKFAKQFKKELLENLDDSDIAYFVYETQSVKQIMEIEKNEIGKIYVSKGKLGATLKIGYRFGKDNGKIVSIISRRISLINPKYGFEYYPKDIRLIRVISPEIITKVDNIIAPINSKTIKKL